MAFDGVTLKMFHGGIFKKVGETVIYCGKQSKTFNMDPDELCWWDLEDRAKSCGDYSKIESIHYIVPGKGFEDGLKRVYNDDEVREMGQLILNERSLDLFVVEGELGSDPYNLVHENPKRPPKLTPKKGPSKFITDNTLRKSPRTASKQPTQSKATNLNPNTTERPKTHEFSYTKDTSAEFPDVIFLGTQVSTTDQATSKLKPAKKQTTSKKTHNAPTNTTSNKPLIETISKKPYNPPTSKQKQSSQNSTRLRNIPSPQEQSPPEIVVTSVPENYEWEDPRPESPIPYSDLLGNSDKYEDDADGEDESDHDYEPEDEKSAEEEDDEAEGDVYVEGDYLVTNALITVVILVV